MSPTTTVLITGCKSGIGKTFLAAYAARENTTVIAAIRDGPSSGPGEELVALPTGSNSKILVVKYDAANEDSVHAMAKDLEANHGITKLDIVIANAGILKHWGPARSVKAAELFEHLSINTIAPIQLYQATIPLLEKADRPRFFIISSSLGSNGLMDEYKPMQMIAYNMSKSAVNAAAGRIHREEERLTVIPVQPGWIATDMGSRAAVWAGMTASDPPVNVDEAVQGLMNLFDVATKEDHSGKFFDQKYVNSEMRFHFAKAMLTCYPSAVAESFPGRDAMKGSRASV